MKNLFLFSMAILISHVAVAAPDMALAPSMWHKIRDGQPVTEPTIQQSSYIVLDRRGDGRASFQIALVPGDNVIESLKQFQKTTGMKSGKGEAVFNVEASELDQWQSPSKNGGSNHVPSKIEKPREGLMVCLFSGSLKEKPGTIPPPHCHAMLAGVDDLDRNPNIVGGYPAVGGHLGDATVHVVLEMQVDAYPEVIEKTSGGPELGGFVISVSDRQVQSAKALLAKH